MLSSSDPPISVADPTAENITNLKYKFFNFIIDYLLHIRNSAYASLEYILFITKTQAGFENRAFLFL